MKNKPIRVLHVDLTRSFGGIAAYQMNLYSNIDTERVQMDFITTWEHAAAQERARTMGAKIFRIPGQRQPLAYMRGFRDVLLKNSYRIVHIHKNSAANILPFIVCKRYGVPVIIAHAHSTRAIDGRAAAIPHYINRGVLGGMITKGFACSNAAAKWMFGRDFERSGKFEIAHNGIELERFSAGSEARQRIRSELGLEHFLTIGHVGNFIRPKNHAFILKIFREIQRIRPNSKLLLMGTGELMEPAMRLALSLGISEHVVFAGNKSNIEDYYQAMDVLLMPSLHEGLPFAGIEAQASGLPCVFSDTITNEIAVTELANFFSLRESAEAWAKKVLNIAGCVSVPHRSYLPELRAAGYDAAENAKKMQDFYLTCDGEYNA